MAIYGISLYGRTKYGPESSRFVDYAVDPFVADAPDYDNVKVSWRSPKGDWTQMRLLRNWVGFPTTENDGEILLDVTYASSEFIDAAVKPGEWHYYALWIKAGDGVWQQSATACTLMLRNHDYATLLFDGLPAYHRLTQGVNDDLPSVENEELRGFLQVLGAGLDYAKTYYESMRFLNDPMRNRLSHLVLLGEQFGVQYSAASPTGQFRKRVLNAANLAREKGTFEGIRSVVSMTTGWDVDLSLGANLMLDEDHASFVHPTYEDWNPAVNYPANAMVNYNGFLYKAAGTGAYGDAQKPSGTSSNNAYWMIVSNTVDTTLKDADGSFARWSAVSYTNGVSPPTNAVAVGVGVQSATDPNVKWANTLLVQNTGGVSADLGARAGGGSSLTDPTKAVKRAVPIPRGSEWSATTAYGTGDVVTYQEHTYTAVSESLGVTPTTTSADWQRLTSASRRYRVTASIHVKGDNAASQARVAYPVLNLFDEHGALLGTLDAFLEPTSKTFDSFRANAYAVSSSLSGASTDSGSKTWTATGTINEVGAKGAYVNVGSYATIDGTADGRVAVTFDSQTTGATQGLVLRGSADMSTYLKATRTGLYSVTSGTPTLIGSYTAFKDGERITVLLSGTNITVYNGSTVALQTTSSFNSTATKHGIVVT